jgi:transposase-like protein
MEFVTAAELAREWNVAPSTVLNWVETRGLPAVRLSPQVIRFDRAAVGVWLEAQTTTPPEPSRRAELERKRIVDRIKNAIANRKREGLTGDPYRTLEALLAELEALK